MALSQSLHQKQLLKLLPQQIQLMKLLQVPTANLEERIKEELEENPALELTEEDSRIEDKDLDGQESLDDYESVGDEKMDNDAGEELAQDYDSLDLNDYGSDDDVADYRMRDEHGYDSEESKPCPIKWKPIFMICWWCSWA